MESKRQAKFARQVQKDMGEIFQREGQQLFGNPFISVSQVRVTPDLGYVKIYLTFLNEKNPETLLNLIKQYNKELRTKLAQRIRNTVRKIPEIEFFYDDTMDFVERIDKLFDKIHKDDKDKE
ncbi:MAG: 30S ribosome-binding factor RbfA [Bacteroidota bacterium]|nr:30S ribosome-binding factor RbfA [Bacteroidota bacterium]